MSMSETSSDSSSELNLPVVWPPGQLSYDHYEAEENNEDADHPKYGLSYRVRNHCITRLNLIYFTCWFNESHQGTADLQLVMKAYITLEAERMLIVYRKGDLVKDPMKSRDVVPKMFWAGLGHKIHRVGVGWVMK